jgi:hypothetical protein
MPSLVLVAVPDREERDLLCLVLPMAHRLTVNNWLVAMTSEEAEKGECAKTLHHDGETLEERSGSLFSALDFRAPPGPRRLSCGGPAKFPSPLTSLRLRPPDRRQGPCTHRICRERCRPRSSSRVGSAPPPGQRECPRFNRRSSEIPLEPSFLLR